MTGDVLAAVRSLLPTIAERAESVDENRVLSEQTMRELADAGVFRLLQPKRYGGVEADPVEFYEVIREIAGACGSTGWVAAVVGVHPWQLGLFDERVQDEVWGSDPGTLVCSSYAPVGRLTAVDGGYRLTGRWSFSSGCDHASWALLGGLVHDGVGKPRDILTVAVPRADFEVVDVWDATGLRGTGSNDVTVEQAFVPEHRILRNYDHAMLRGPGQRVNTGPLYRMPFGAIFTAAVTAPLVGAASGAYRHYLSAMRECMRLSLGGGRFVEDQFAQVAVARAASEIDAAIMQTDRNVGDLYRAAASGEIPMELRLRARRDQARGTERTVEAIDLLFKTARGRSLRRGNPIGRAWRDVHAGSVHVANDAERALAFYGRGAFGLDVEDTLI